MTAIQAAAIGAACGLRAFSGPGVLAWRGGLGDGPLRAVMLTLAAGELAGDKLPWTPPRTAPPALAARIASGACCGHRLGGPAGAALGVAAAVGAAFAGQHARAALVAAFPLPDAAVALAEDAGTYALAAAATRP